MNANSQLVVNVHIHSKLPLQLRIPDSHPHSIDAALTRFVREHKIKDTAVPFMKEQIKRQILTSQPKNPQK